MISLAGRDIMHSWGKFVLTGIGLGLLIGVTLTMAGVYRGMVDDARALLDNSGADLWVVQQDTQGPYAESSSLRDDVVRSVLALPGVARAANVTYLTMQVRASVGRDTGREVRAMIVGFEPGQPAQASPGYLVAGRHITRSHYEAVVDVRTGFTLGQRIRIRRHDYTVVGLTQRMVSSGGDPMVFIPLKDAQEAQFLKDNDAILNDRARTAANPALNRPGVPGPAGGDPGLAGRQSQRQRGPGAGAARCASRDRGRTDPALEAPGGLHARADGRDPDRQADRHVGEADRHVPGDPGHRQRGHRRLHHLHDDAGQDPRDRGAQAHRHAQPHDRRDDPAAGAGLGLIGFIVGKVAATFWAPIFPKYVLLEVNDALLGLVAVMVICALASTLAIRAALAVDPAAAIGG
jgi:putative ABC transport system permease protein